MTPPDRIAALTRLDAEPTPDEAAAFRAAVLEFYAALDAEGARRVEAVIDAAYAAADAELAGDTGAAERHRAYGLALYRGAGATGPDWWMRRPAPSGYLPFFPPPDRPVPSGRWFKSSIARYPVRTRRFTGSRTSRVVSSSTNVCGRMNRRLICGGSSRRSSRPWRISRPAA